MPGAVSLRLARASRRAVATLFTTAVILAYHRVAEPELDPQLLCVAPERFAAQLAAAAELGTVLSLRDLVRRAAMGRVPARAVAVTFDDGYADNLAAAEPLLRAVGAPATVFVASGGVEERELFWWDELEELLLRSAHLPARLVVTSPAGDREFSIDPATTVEPRADDGWDITQEADPTPRHAAYRRLFRLCRSLALDDRRRVLDELAAQVGEPAAGDGHRRLTPEEIARLADGDLVEVGAHGVSHAPFSALTAAQQRDELWESKRQVAAWSGRPVDLLSYPLGAPGDLTAECVALARDCGFMAACANSRGVVWRHGDPYRLPRYLVRDWEPEDFARRLESWLTGRA